MQKYIRIQDPKTIDSRSILNQINGDDEVIIQFSETVTDLKLLQQINDLCKAGSRNLCVRFYGHYKTGLDCSVLKHLPDVKSLYLDCLHSASNFSELRKLNSLEKLNVGIYELDEKDFLSWENLKGVSFLCLVDTRKNNLDLRYLNEYPNVENLFLNGHTKNIDAIGTMSKLSELSLCIPSKASVSFVNQLSKLRQLRLILGGRANLEEIQNYGIEELEIVRVRGFSSFDNLSEFTKLKRLLIEDQIQIKKVSIAKELPNLVDFKILNCKTLAQLEGVHHLTALHQLRIYRTAIEFSDFVKQEFPKSLRILAFYTAKAKINKAIKDELGKLGYVDGLAQ